MGEGRGGVRGDECRTECYYLLMTTPVFLYGSHHMATLVTCGTFLSPRNNAQNPFYTDISIASGAAQATTISGAVVVCSD